MGLSCILASHGYLCLRPYRQDGGASLGTDVGWPVTHHRGWLLALLLVLSCLPLRLAPVPLTAHDPCPSEQHEAPDGKLSEEARLNTSQPRPRRLRVRLLEDQALPRARPEPRPTVRLESLVQEDPRHALLPRWTAPPEPHPHA